MSSSIPFPPPAYASANVKGALLVECRRRQQEKADAARRAMDDAQASANDHAGAMEDKFESFRENCQIQRDLFARQLDDALTGLAVLRRLDEAAARPGAPAAAPVIAGLGGLVETDRGGRFFLAISLGPIPDPAGGSPWLAVSTSSPIGQALVGRRVDDTLLFRGETHRLTAIG
ncbi:MAG: hypothetical protein H7330_09380 [Hymenobacteraceae bacterium]|nr:hypothetical protein [Hymenobacteraceae bacterium]